MINIKSVEYEWVFVVGKYQGSISLKQFSSVFGCHSKNDNFYLFTLMHLPGSGYQKSSTLMHAILVHSSVWGRNRTMRACTGNSSLCRTARFLTGLPTKSLKKNRKKSSDCCILRESFGGKCFEMFLTDLLGFNSSSSAVVLWYRNWQYLQCETPFSSTTLV